MARSASSKAAPETVMRSAGSASITAVHVWAESRSPRIASASSCNAVATALAAQRSGTQFDPAEPMRNLDELGELRQPRGDRDLLAGPPVRPAFTVPELVGRADGVLHRRREPEALGQCAGEECVPRNHAVEVAAAGDRELEPNAEAVERRVAAADEPHRSRRGPAAAQVVVVLAGTQRDVVAEPL